MPLPNEFSPAEHLQDLLKNVVNREVREWFADLGDNWEPDIGTPRSSLRVGCTHVENDSMDMTLMRLMLFYLVTGKGQALQAPIYGIPTDAFQQKSAFLPQVKLYFHEDLDDVEEGYQPIDAEITYRVMGETSESMTETKARVIANKIRSEFCPGGGYRWHKGRVKCSYIQPERGYRMQLNAYSVAEAKQVINKILDLNGHSPDWNLLVHSQYDNSPPIIPPSKRIYGKTRRTARKRPVAYVRFRYAELHVHGVQKAITLVDRTNRRRQALIKA